MDSQVRSILDFISATKRTFIIPVYQRNYSWDKDNCDQLFNDLMESLTSGKKHYFGNIVYYAMSTDFASGYSELALIDGQQRVTTIMLLLAALRDLSEDVITKNNIQSTYLTNPQSNEPNRVKLKQIESDQPIYESIINGSFNDENGSNAGRNYLFFKQKIKESGKSPNEILSAINNLQVVALDLKLKEQGNLSESPQIIFESINATGKKLSDADLIRNWLLIGIPEEKQDYFYKAYWTKIESNTETADGVIDFINRYLVLMLSDKILKGSEYRTFKRSISRMFVDSDNPYESALDSLCHYSKYYKWIKHPDSVIELPSQVREIFINLNEIGNEFAIPVLMFLSEKADSKNSSFDFAGLAKAARYLEDWMFRARITRNITAGNIGSVLARLVQLINKSGFDGNYDEILYYELSNYRTADIWPNNDDFKRAFSHYDFYNNRFYKNYVQRKLEYFISNDRINTKPDSIEHIMPETLNAYWRGILGENYAQLHAEYLHTIGNLAPMNQPDNSVNSNDPYEKKRPQFKSSSWKLTRDIDECYDTWDIDNIKDRSNKLAEMAANIWIAPLVRERQLEATTRGSIARVINDDIRKLTFKISRVDHNGNNIDCIMMIQKNASGKNVYVVMPGSAIVPESYSMNEAFKKTFEQSRLKNADKLLKKNNLISVESEIQFDSPSPAACFCTGYSENGWDVWVDSKTGKNLDELAREHNDNTEYEDE